MIGNISDILHYSLDSDGDMPTLMEEISITKSYLEIQSVRYRNQFEAVWDYPSDIKDIRIVKLILQPLVENSVYTVSGKRRVFIDPCAHTAGRELKNCSYGQRYWNG